MSKKQGRVRTVGADKIIMLTCGSAAYELGQEHAELRPLTIHISDAIILPQPVVGTR